MRVSHFGFLRENPCHLLTGKVGRHSSSNTALPDA